MTSRIFFAFFVLTLMISVNRQTFAQTMPPLETGVSQTLAVWRAKNYSDVRYKLNITLEKGAPLMKGDIEIRVNLSEEGAKNDLVLDWRTTQFQNDKDKPFAEVVAVNGTTGAQASLLALSAEREPTAVYLNAADSHDRFRTKNALNASKMLALQSNEHLLIPQTLLKTGENVIKINFASPIKTSGAAITRYVDKEDNAEYIYSLFVPSDASTAFPCFDQPDLKARFQLSIDAPKGWEVVSNTDEGILIEGKTGSIFGLKEFKGVGHFFEETKPISTYVFAFAVGDFEEFTEKDANEAFSELVKEGKSFKGFKTDKGKTVVNSSDIFVSDSDIRAKTGTHVFVRKSQAEKFKQHSAEVFRLNREAVKYLESYFDYKFPFPKYDFVLIPEFPFGGMEHAGATFLRESSVIFPTEPTKNDYISRATLIFHETAHQWFGDTVTMRWFDDLWLKEGFAEFMAYKTLEKVMPEYNAWKIFYERNKQAAYLTDSTRGTTPIYQEIPNLSAAKSAYGNIVYRKAPSFLRQAEFYLGADNFKYAVRAFLKKHEFANAEWTDLVKEFEIADKTLGGSDLTNAWITQRGLWKIKLTKENITRNGIQNLYASQNHSLEGQNENPTIFNENLMKFKVLVVNEDGTKVVKDFKLYPLRISVRDLIPLSKSYAFVFPNYQDYGYGIFLLDEKSRAYVLANIQTEKDDFLRTMMWGALWDSVRETELAPQDYVALVIKNISVESDESTINTLLGRVSTAMNYYLSESQRAALITPLEDVLIDKIQNAPTLGMRITFYRAFLNIASSEKARTVLKQILNDDLGIGGGNTKMRPGVMNDKSGKQIFAASPAIPLKNKDKFDIITRLAILGDNDAPKLLADLQKSETSDEAKRYAYAAQAGFPTKEAKEKYFNDFLSNKEISESWIEAAFVPFNASKHADLTLPYLEKALRELPNLKRNRKIFFVNGWLAAFISGQKSAEALTVVNKFLADNPNLDKDLRLKILENSDALERAVKIRAKFGK